MRDINFKLRIILVVAGLCLSSTIFGFGEKVEVVFDDKIKDTDKITTGKTAHKVVYLDAEGKKQTIAQGAMVNLILKRKKAATLGKPGKLIVKLVNTFDTNKQTVNLHGQKVFWGKDNFSSAVGVAITFSALSVAVGLSTIVVTVKKPISTMWYHSASAISSIILPLCISPVWLLALLQKGGEGKLSSENSIIGVVIKTVKESEDF